MAALMRNSRVPVWILCSHLRQPSLVRTVHSLHRSSRIPSASPLTQTVTRCTSTTTVSSAGVAQSATEETYSGAQVDRMIVALDRNVRRFGRLGLNDVTGVLQQIEKEGVVTDTQSLLLIRCMGTTLAEIKPEDRTRQADQMWEKMKSFGASYGTQHYNALLRVYLQNENRFSPTDFLADMESNKVAPNRVTYQRLIARYCQDGDIKGASQILEHMKAHSLPVNEQVFNALIMGHFRANDVESANGMLDIMNQAGMEAGVETYRALINGYAEKGDMAGVRQIVSKASDSGITLNPSICFDTILTLAKTGYEAEARQYLPTIQKLPGYSTEAMSCCLQLTSISLDDLAYDVFNTIGKPVTYDKQDSKLGRFLIRGMVRAERPPEKIETMLEKMRAEQYNNDTIALVPQLAYLNKQTDYALAVLDYMNKQGIPMRDHYYWPAICQYRDKGDKQKLKSVVRQMQESCDQNDIFQTVEEFVLPAFLQLGVPEDNIVSEIAGTGIRKELVNFAYVLYLLKTKGVEEALQFGEENPVFVLYGALKPVLVPLYRKTKDLQSVLKVLKFAGEVGRSPNLSMDTNSWFVFDFIYNTTVSASKDELFLEMKKLNLNIPQEDVEDVKNLCSQHNITLSAEAVEALESLGSGDVSTGPRRRPSSNQLQLGNKSQQSLEQLMSIHPGDLSVQKFLLSKYCQNGEIEKAAQLKDKLDSTGFVYTDYIIRQLAYLESAHKQDLKAAEDYIEQLNRQYPDYGNYVRPLLNVAALKIKDGRADESLTTLLEYCDRQADFIKEQKFSDSYMLQTDCIRVIEALSEAKRLDLAQSFIQTFFERGLIRHGTANILRSYMEAFIKMEDIDGAVNALSWITSTYTKSTVVNDLMKLLIQKEDPERLQKVVDMLTPLRGEMNVLHLLMIAFIECGDIKKAKKIVETPGIRAVMNVLVIACGQLVNDRRLKELEDLVSVTKSLFGADRDELLFQLIRFHALERDWPKALNVLIDFEEEGIQPRPRTLRYLAKALEADGQPVPFEVPQPFLTDQVVTEEKAASVGQDTQFVLTPVEQKAMALIKSGGWSAVLDMKKDLEQSDDKKQAEKFIPSLVSFLLEKKHFRDFRKLIQELALIGEVETLQDLKTLVDSEEGQRNICQQIFHAHLNCNRTEEVLSHLEANPSEADLYLSNSGFNVFVQKNPDMIGRFENLADLSTTTSYKLTNQLWCYYFRNEEDSKANEILEKYPEMKKSLRVFQPCQHAVATKQEDRLLSLLEIVKENKVAQGVVYRSLLLMHSYNDDADSIVRVIDQLTNDGLQTVEIIRDTSRNKLISVFQSQGKPIPTQLAYVPGKSSSSSDSKSSSSSSSDEETESKDR